MRAADIPMPRAVAARPRDGRGYPVPAITPWPDGRPLFGLTGVARSFLCAIERRCSVCATPMAPGPVWRVVAGAEAQAISDAIAAGRPYVNLASTVEAPGHRVCMLYAAVTCPYLSRSSARRGQDTVAAQMAVARGSRRGEGGAVVGFTHVEFSYTGTVEFRFAGVCEFRWYEWGEEQLGELAAAIADEEVAAVMGDGVAVATNGERASGGAVAAVPDYLLADEGLADRRFAAYLGAAG